MVIKTNILPEHWLFWQFFIIFLQFLEYHCWHQKKTGMTNNLEHISFFIHRPYEMSTPPNIRNFITLTKCQFLQIFSTSSPLPNVNSSKYSQLHHPYQMSTPPNIRNISNNHLQVNPHYTRISDELHITLFTDVSINDSKKVNFTVGFIGNNS